MLNVKEIGKDMEKQYQEAVIATEEIHCKYGCDIEYNLEKLPLEDRIKFEVNRQLRYKLYYFLDKYINSNIMVKCKQCGKEYVSNQGHDEFCSIKCWDEYYNG